jgi:hypothetical protein
MLHFDGKKSFEKKVMQGLDNILATKLAHLRSLP